MVSMEYSEQQSPLDLLSNCAIGEMANSQQQHSTVVLAELADSSKCSSSDTVFYLDNRGNITTTTTAPPPPSITPQSLSASSPLHVMCDHTASVVSVQDSDSIPSDQPHMSKPEEVIHIEGELAEDLLSDDANCSTFSYADAAQQPNGGECSASTAANDNIGKRSRKPTSKGEAYKKKVLSQCKKQAIEGFSPPLPSPPSQLSPVQLSIVKQQSPNTHTKKDSNQQINSPHKGTNDKGCTSTKKRRKRKIQLSSQLNSGDKKRFGKVCPSKRTPPKGPQPTYCCIKCPRTFSKISQLKSHFRSHTEQEDPIKLEQSCCDCDLTFENARLLRVHQQQQHSAPSNSLQCNLCSSSFTHSASFKVHMRVHRGEKPYQCTECGAEFVQSGHLMIHKRIHTGEKPYTCDICYVQFKQISHLKTHVRTHTQDKPYKCDECSAAFAQNSSLKRHKRSHSGEKPFKCDVCDMTFVVKSNLQRHSFIHTGEKPYSCDICVASFGQVIDLKRHKISHTGIKPYKCDLCDARFSRNNNLKWHRLTHAEGASYKCETCEVLFATPGDLRFHKRVHEPPRPFQCSVCPASFQQNCSLNNHQLIHTSDFPTIKKLINKKRSTAVKSALNNNKQFTCSICGTRFCEKRSWRRHMIAVHSETQPKCKTENVKEELIPNQDVMDSLISGDCDNHLSSKMKHDRIAATNEVFSTVSFQNNGNVIGGANQLLGDVLATNCVGGIVDQSGVQVMTNTLSAHQQQQLPQLLIQGIPTEVPPTPQTVINGPPMGTIIPNTEMEQYATINTQNSGFLSQLIIATAPGGPAKQAKPAGNCLNTSAHFLTLVDVASNQWQAWCLCDSPQVATTYGGNELMQLPVLAGTSEGLSLSSKHTSSTADLVSTALASSGALSGQNHVATIALDGQMSLAAQNMATSGNIINSSLGDNTCVVVNNPDGGGGSGCQQYGNCDVDGSGNIVLVHSAGDVTSSHALSSSSLVLPQQQQIVSTSSMAAPSSGVLVKLHL